VKHQPPSTNRVATSHSLWCSKYCSRYHYKQRIIFGQNRWGNFDNILLNSITSPISLSEKLQTNLSHARFIEYWSQSSNQINCY
jgi:hypothetical protein